MYACKKLLLLNFGRQMGVHDSELSKVVDPESRLKIRCKSEGWSECVLGLRRVINCVGVNKIA
jgi:hypothetical protein